MGVLRHASTAPRSIPNTNTNRIPITNPKPKTIPDPMPIDLDLRQKKTPSYPQNKVMWKSKHPLLNTVLWFHGFSCRYLKKIVTS